jgi:hypothetical protein
MHEVIKKQEALKILYFQSFPSLFDLTDSYFAKSVTRDSRMTFTLI